MQPSYGSSFLMILTFAFHGRQQPFKYMARSGILEWVNDIERELNGTQRARFTLIFLINRSLEVFKEIANGAITGGTLGPNPL